MRILAALLAAVTLLDFAPARAAEPYQIRVERVIDGDTIDATVFLGLDVSIRRAIRLRGIDTPELRGRCPGERALALRAYVLIEELLDHLPVTIAELGDDRYGRVLARVTAGGVDVGAALIAAGLARAYDGGERAGWCEP